MTWHDRPPLSPEQASTFLTAHPVFVYEPATGARVATVTYDADGTCLVRFQTGPADAGSWGSTQAGYWTRYDTFRDGQRTRFTLVEIGSGIYQAFHDGGARAFVQSHLTLSPSDVTIHTG